MSPTVHHKKCKYAQNILTGRFNTPLSMPVRVHITIFFFFEVKVYTYIGKVRKIQVTGSSSFCWRACQKSWGQYCPLPPGPDRVNRSLSRKQGRKKVIRVENK